MDDLFKAMQMFKNGVQDLSLSRIMNSANEQVEQIRQSELSDQQKFNELNNLGKKFAMSYMGLGGTASGAETMIHAMVPKVYTPEEQYDQASYFGNEKGMKEAADKIKEKKKATNVAQIMRYEGLGEKKNDKAQDQIDQANTKMFSSFSKDLDASAASSRSPYGQWASVEGRGERLRAILGNPESWKAMTPEALELVKEGVVQMSKGGVMTQEEHKTMSPFMFKLKQAQAETAMTGEPTTLDLSGFAGLYNGIIDKEGAAAKEAIKNIILTRANGNRKLYDRDADQFKLTVADRLRSQAGLDISPEDLEVDKKKGISIKGETKEAKKEAPKASVEMVSVISPDGKQGKIPRSNLKNALKKGFKVK